MARKQKAPEHENLERWLVSYADFITLLFAFFVVMYSISSVNEGKYRVLSDSLVAAFRSPTKTLQPIQVGQSSKSPVSEKFQIRQSPFAIDIPDMPLPWVKNRDVNDEQKRKPSSGEGKPIDEMLEKMMQAGKLNISLQAKTAISEKLKELNAQAAREAAAASQGLSADQIVVMQKIADEVQQAMQTLIDKNLIAVRRSELWVEVEIKASVLFASGDASINPQAIPVLKELARILKPFPNVIRVEGFTDDVPIKNAVYPSNWELSSARAARVVRLFIDRGIRPQRLLAVGYGQFHPVADNGTSEGRQKNRRVVLVVLASRANSKAVNKDLRDVGKSAGNPPEDVYEDKGILTPEEAALPPTVLPAVATAGTAATPPESPAVPGPAAAKPSPPASTPPAPPDGPAGVTRRAVAVPPETTLPAAGTVDVIPAPIQVQPPINLAPPLSLPGPANLAPVPPPVTEIKP
jgi:chemotaxis protein MotB